MLNLTHINKMRLNITLGTRPEIIKMSPIIKKCQERGIDFFVIHTGQHYSYNMDQVFFKELELPEPEYNLNIGSGRHGEQTGAMLTGIEKVLLEEQCDVVLVQGDTNTVLAGALAASKLNVPVGHVEAGLRSYDRTMPEEVNRLAADHLSDFLFAPTRVAESNLVREGVDTEKIFVTGNTIVDAVFQNLEISTEKCDPLSDFCLKSDEYFLTTVHRSENVDDVNRLTEIIRGLNLLYDEMNLPIVFPIHPRTRKMIESNGVNVSKLMVVSPVDFLSFLQLEANAKLVLTDSGGVQEETCILKVPCVTLRENTERPETIDVGSNIIAGIKAENILDAAINMMNRDRNWANPFGDGDASTQIINILIKENVV